MLMSKIRWANWSIYPLDKRWYDIVKELNIKKNKSPKGQITTIDSVRIQQLEKERNYLKNQVDSVKRNHVDPLWKKRDSLFKLYADEITRDKATHNILQKIRQKADSITRTLAKYNDEYVKKVRNKESTDQIFEKIKITRNNREAYAILKNYVDILRSDLDERLKNYEIDIDICRLEIRSTYKIEEVLSNAAFPPISMVTVVGSLGK
jgi:hypothetical protein